MDKLYGYVMYNINMKTKNLPITIALCAVLFAPLSVLAQTTPTPAPTNTPAPATTTRTNARAAALADKKAERCALINTKVDQRISKFDDASGLHNTRYESIVTKLREVSDKIKVRGTDTAALDASISSLEEKRQKILSDKSAMITKLQESKTLTCGESQGEFKAKIEEARTLQKSINTTAVEMRQQLSAIRETLKTMRAGISSTPSPRATTTNAI